ncbi:MAG: lipid kinase [Wenzhouxiangellaceae bacterium]
MTTSTLLITNPGSRLGESSLDELGARFRDQGKVVERRPERAQDLPDLIRRHGPEVDRVVLGGGDGTVNLALDALLEVERPLGLLPLGTANDLARSLEIPQELEKAVAVILSGNLRKVDVAFANEVSFINAIGMGLGPQMTREMDSETKSNWGMLAYMIGMARAFREPRHFNATIRVDGREETYDCVQITVANGIHYGGGMTIVDDAKLDDGQLDVLIVRKQSRLSLLGSIDRMRSGHTRAADNMWHFRCSELSITTDPVIEVTFDGEFLGRTPLHCTVRRHALRIYAPD